MVGTTYLFSRETEFGGLHIGSGCYLLLGWAKFNDMYYLVSYDEETKKSTVVETKNIEDVRNHNRILLGRLNESS